jgi:Spy/CpxP family protein refolding chaperone
MKTIVSAIMIVAITSMGMVQGKKGGDFDPAERAKARTEKLKAELSLDDKQTVQVEAALLTKMTKMKEVRAKHKEDKTAMRNAVKPINEEFRKNMQAILTPEQQAKWKENKQEKRKEIRSENLKDELDLTDEQVEELDAALQARKEKAKALRAKHGENKKALGKEMKTVNEEFRAEVKEILSEEQYAKWEAMKTEKRENAGKGRKGGKPKK